MKYLLECLFFPPGINLLVTLVVLALWRTRPPLAAALLMLDVVVLYACSLPLTGWLLMSALQPFPALKPTDLARDKAQAIVVLGAGRYSNAPEYGGDTVSRFELERLRYGVRLQRLTHLPLMLVGGASIDEGGVVPEALLMKAAATEDLGATVTWVETRSHTTAENAANAAAILRAHGIRRIYLVTHAWHMPRAAWAFRHTGLAVIPAPTAFVTALGEEREQILLPSARALYEVNLGLHEATGLLWYRLTLPPAARVPLAAGSGT